VTLVVNGRFLRAARPTGMHRVARSLVEAARARGLDAEVLAPPGVEDALVDRTVWGPPGRFGDHAWEQLSLPVAAGSRPLLSLLNTAPAAPRRAATMVHDLGFRVGPQWYSGGTRAYGAVVMAAARRARVVLTVSHAVADELVAAGLSAQRLRVVRPAADPRWRPQPADRVDAVRARFGLERPYCLVIGWKHARKDAQTVVEAHLKLVSQLPHDLVLVGTGHQTFRSVRLPDHPSIRVLGYVADTDLPALMGGAAAFLYPSLYEGFGIPVVEALQCATPAIVSDLPVLREASEGAAHFVPPGDVERWAAAIEAAVGGQLPRGAAPAWTWDDAAGQLISALAPLM
jgi:glycosyltransferase involved in cell wall biosynthesis